MAVDPIVTVVELFKKRNNLSSDEFIELNGRYSILEFIAEHYESFHLSGNEGILEDINEHIKKQKGSQ